MITLEGTEKLPVEKVMGLIGKIKAVIYARVSTTDQAKNGYSLDSQIERCRNRAIEKYGYKENELIVLVEAGGMGDDPNRPALNYALHLLEKGLGKTLIVLHPDRLTRDNTLQGVISRRLWNMGVDIDFIEFEVDPNNPESMLMYNIQGSIAQYNKAKILANSRRGRIQKAKKGELATFRRMFGYTYNVNTDKLEINEEEKDAYLMAVDLLLNQSYTTYEISKELSSRGVRAPLGDVWYPTTLTRMLHNYSYTGNYYYGKTKTVQTEGKKKQVPRPKEEWIRIQIPPIIDEETYHRIQAAIKENDNNPIGRKRGDFLLRGMTYCGRCGGTVGTGTRRKLKNGTIYHYYTCTRKTKRGYKVGTSENIYKKCDGKNWRTDVIDEVVWKWVIDLIGDPEKAIQKFTELITDTDKIGQLKIKKEKIIKELKKLESEDSRYIMLFGKGKISEKQYDALSAPIKANTDRLEEDLKVIENQLMSAENDVKGIDRLKETLQLYQKKVQNYDALPIEEKRKLVNAFVKKVYLHEDDTLEIIAVWDSGRNNDSSLLSLDDGKGASVSKERYCNYLNRQAYGRQNA